MKNKTIKNKSVIHVWTHDVSNSKSDEYNNYWGLGDIIRGTIKLFQLSKKMGFKLIVDFQHHPISNFLKKQNHIYESFILENKNNIPFIFGDDNEVENYILKNNDKDVLFFLTNNKYNEPINESCKIFIKNLLTMNDSFYSFYEEKRKELLFDEYNILHFRLGDDELVRKIYNNNYEKQLNIINLLNKENKYVLVSDSLQFKNYINDFLKDKKNIFMFNIDIGHFGYHTDLEVLRNTLFEFFLIIHSKKINSFSVYPWMSGFVKIANTIYDVETEII